MWKRLLGRLFGSKQQTDEAPSLGIIPGKDGSDCFTRPTGNVRISTKGDCSLTIGGDGKMVVHADDPVIEGSGASNVIVFPAKK